MHSLMTVQGQRRLPVFPQLRKCPVRSGSYASCHKPTPRNVLSRTLDIVSERIVLLKFEIARSCKFS